MVGQMKQMKILIVYYSETGNTAQIARAIHVEALSLGHGARLKAVSDVEPAAFSAYDLVIFGAACHDSELARPAKALLDQLPHSPAFKLAGFVTHATVMPAGSERDRRLYERWAAGCERSFREAALAKKIDFLGYFSCQGAASPAIEQYIHKMILTDEAEWGEYVEDLRTHPGEEDVQGARTFVRDVLARCRGLVPGVNE